MQGNDNLENCIRECEEGNVPVLDCRNLPDECRNFKDFENQMEDCKEICEKKVLETEMGNIRKVRITNLSYKMQVASCIFVPISLVSCKIMYILIRLT